MVITQPTYLPWIGYFEQIARADVFVILDNVQFEPRSWQCRNRLRGASGDPFWLSVPIAAHRREARICDVGIAHGQLDWRRRHLKSIATSLGGTPFFAEVFPRLEAWLARDHGMLVALNVDGIREIAALLDLVPRWMLASDLPVTGAKGDLILDLCRHLGAGTYYTAAGAREYLQPVAPRLRESGIRLVFQDWAHPVYRQRGEGFVSHLSVVDALMNVGPAAVRDMVTAA